MAMMIGRTKSWLAWLAGSALALVFGGAGCDGGSPQVLYGPPPQPPPPANPPASSPATGLEASAQWKQIVSVWPEAEEIASGKRGDYPFDEKGQKRVLGNLDRALKGIDALLAAGLLSVPEAGFLTKDLEALAIGVKSKRPVEMQNATCYRPMYVCPTGAGWSFERLASRLPLLEKLAEGGKLHRAATGKILEAVEADLALLSDEKALTSLKDSRQKAEETRDAVKAQVLKLKLMLVPEEQLRKATCYDAIMVPEKPQSARKIEERMAVLDKIQQHGRIPSHVAAIVRQDLNRRLAELQEPSERES